MSIAGGPAITLCQFSGIPLGASWGDDNTITFATNAPRTGLWRVSADGGEPTILTTADPAQHEGTYSFPSVLPLGRGVLFTIATASQADSSSRCPRPEDRTAQDADSGRQRRPSTWRPVT